MFKFVNYYVGISGDEYHPSIYSAYSTKVEKGRFKQNQKSYPILYYHKGKIVGGLKITYYNKDKSLYISNLFIEKKYQNQKLGSKMVKEFCSFCKKRFEGKIDKLELDVFADNEPALRIYKKAGFEITEDIEDPFTDICYAYSMTCNI